MGIPLRVLMIEDSEDDARLLKRELERAGYDLTHERVDTAAALKAALDRHPWDVVLGDYSMPQFSGTAALAILQERGLDTPYICVSGTITEELAVAAMKMGASDYVTKGHLKRLVPAIERELREAQARAALRATEASHATLVEHAPVGIYRSTPEGRFLTVNAAIVRMLGYDAAADVLRLDMARDVYADPAERQRLVERDTYSDRQYDDVEATWKRKDGGLLTVQLSVRAVRNSAGRVDYYETFVRDVTDQRRLQQQLLQSQKMEAVGRLAGGIAHDFNNLLTVITSYSSLLLEDLAPDDSKRDDLEQVRKAADAAAALTRQLLTFSRQQVVEPRVVSLNSVVENFQKILHRVIGEDVALATQLAPDLGPVLADVGHLEQTLMNLAVNARDAMPTGGTLTIETANVEHEPDFARGSAAAAVRWFVMLAVSDTGCGMDDATKARLFEPFFTTKAPGKGTGLGLATVYGIVQQVGWVHLGVFRARPGHDLQDLLPAGGRGCGGRGYRGRRPCAPRDGDGAARRRRRRRASRRQASAGAPGLHGARGTQRRGGASVGAEASRSDSSAADGRGDAAGKRAAAGGAAGARPSGHEGAVCVGVHGRLGGAARHSRGAGRVSPEAIFAGGARPQGARRARRSPESSRPLQTSPPLSSARAGARILVIDDDAQLRGAIRKGSRAGRL